MAKYIAENFVAGSPDALVIGETMRAFLENVQGEIIKPIMEKYGMSEIEADKWYPHQIWMDILKDIDGSLEGGAQSAFVAIGRKVVEKAAMPPEINSIPIALGALHAIHHLNLKNIPPDEGYVVKQLGEKHYHVYENTPNPSDAIYGFIWGICARFKQADEKFTVKIIDNPNPEETPGTVFDIVWG